MATTNTAAQAANNPHKLRSVLIARFSALGDVAMTIPVIYSACICYPDVQFVFLTRKSMTSIFLNPPANLQLVGIDLAKDYQGVAGLRRLFGELHRQFKIDGFIDLHDVIRTKILSIFCRLKGIRVSTINKGRRGKRALTRRYNKVLLPLQSTRARYRQAFHRIGLPVDNRFYGLYGDGIKAPADAYKVICPPKPDGMHWVGIAPFAKHKGKIYPTEQMEKVVEAIASRSNTAIFLFGGGEHEAKVLDGWASRFSNVRSLAGKKYGFPAELALVSHLDVMLSMDSANMHLASLVATPVVSVWGATHPYCGFKGWRQSEDDMVQLPITCRPCSVFGNKPCFRGDYYCLQGIMPQAIIRRVEHYLN